MFDDGRSSFAAMSGKRETGPGLLGDLELEIMKVVWELGDASGSEVADRLDERRHHNTVMTVMARTARPDALPSILNWDLPDATRPE